MAERKRIALLIDCDNVSHTAIGGVLEALDNAGMVNVRHAHGDWHNPSLSGWQGKLQPHAIKPVQQFAYTVGKNATDTSMIIDAMDLLYSKNIDAFALMTSDSDFTPLVLRILEDGVPVYGFGAQKTPKPFVKACSVFTYIEQLSEEKITAESEKENKEEQPKISQVESEKTTKKEKTKQTKTPVKQDTKKLQQNIKLSRLLTDAVEQTKSEQKWSNLSMVASYINNNYPTFSLQKYGHKKISELIETIALFNIKKQNNTWYIQTKSQPPK